MQILFISYRCPPIITSESLLIPRTLWALTEHGCRVTLLTVDSDTCVGGSDDKLLDLIPPSVEIIRTRGFERQLTLLRCLPYKFLELFGITAQSDPWYFTAIKAGRDLLKKKNFDCLYSRASTWTSNIVGLNLKRYSGLPWVAHFSDPWVGNPYLFPNYGMLQKKISRKMEARIIREADAIIYTNKQTVDFVMAKYPNEYRKKVYAIPHGYDPRIKTNKSCGEREKKRIRMIHAGHFFQPRTPMKLFTALHHLNAQTPIEDKFELVLIGAVDERYKIAARDLGIHKFISFLGELTYHETNKILLSADLLLLIEASNKDIPSIFLPSKLIDYLPFCKPIIGLVSLQSPSADILRRTGCSVVAPDDVEGISEIVLQIIKSHPKNKLEISPEFTSIYKEYDIMFQTKKLVQIIKECHKR